MNETAMHVYVCSKQCNYITFLSSFYEQCDSPQLLFKWRVYFFAYNTKNLVNCFLSLETFSHHYHNNNFCCNHSRRTSKCNLPSSKTFPVMYLDPYMPTQTLVQYVQERSRARGNNEMCYCTTINVYILGVCVCYNYMFFFSYGKQTSQSFFCKLCLFYSIV